MDRLIENLPRRLFTMNRSSLTKYLRIFTFVFLIMMAISIVLINQHRRIYVFLGNVEKSTYVSTSFRNPVLPNETATKENKLTELIEQVSQLDHDQRVMLLRRFDFTDKEGLDAMKTKLYLMSWPSFKGYDDHKATAQRDGPDTELLDRILLHQQMYTLPMFQPKGNYSGTDRHPWKFEKIIHQTWIDEQIPGKTAPWVKKWLELNPDWTYMFWTDKAAHEFISEHFPALLTPFESWTIPVQKADMFRYIVLYAFGGVYADLDMEVLKNLEEVRNWSSCVLSREPDLQTFIMSNFMNCWGNNWTFTCNAFMACRSHHPFMHYLISRVVHWSPYILKRPCALSATIACTGPWMMSFTYVFYRRSVPEDLRASRKELDVICPEYEWFLPTFDETRTALVKKNCANEKNDERQKRICKTYEERGFKNEPLKDSFTTHHWFHSYHVNVNKELVDIRRETKVLQWTKITEDTDFYITFPGS